MTGVGASSHAQEPWSPTRPIRLVLGYTPGGAADAVARDLAPLMEKSLGQPVIVDYKPGAGGAIAAEMVATAAPDGYTIGLVDGAPLSIIPHARKVSYDPTTSFSYLGVVSKAPLVVLVHPSVQANNLQELLALARAQPGAVSYSTSGLGSIHQMAAELLSANTQTSLLHVPYKGAAPALNDLMAGSVKVSFATIAPAVPLVQSGRVRAIAVTSARPVPAFPGVKPIGEQGVAGYDAQGWFVLAGPKGMPAEITRKINAALNTALQTPALRDKFISQGNDVAPGTPEAATELVNVDFRKWGRVIRDQNLRFD
ncbi:Bug family tripartite tricarboxylate transporter substrate binding protein [Variovorax boronicumulans]|uniref:Bug family tripartite tricarboxylate transporter substrate binding protein n=1 Tax=Variovorax boronicumulans TaxID=436515 RepID=UPI00214A9B32